MRREKIFGWSLPSVSFGKEDICFLLGFLKVCFHNHLIASGFRGVPWGLWSALGGNTVSLRGSPALLDAASRLDSVCDSPGLEDSQQTQEWLLACGAPAICLGPGEMNEYMTGESFTLRKCMGFTGSGTDVSHCTCSLTVSLPLSYSCK